MKKALLLSVGFAIGVWSLLALAFAPYNTVVVMQSGEQLAAGITGHTGGSPVTVLTPTKDCSGLGLENTATVELIATLDGVKFKRVPASSFRAYDIGGNGSRLKSGTVIGVYPAGANPSTGAFEATCTPTF